MSCKYYELCNQHKGRPVVIRERNGQVHRGIIDRVDRNYVYLRPMGRGIGGFGYGFYGPGYGYGGYGWGRVALGAIAGFALASAFFW